jgi:hypothetical protein
MVAAVLSGADRRGSPSEGASWDGCSGHKSIYKKGRPVSRRPGSLTATPRPPALWTLASGVALLREGSIPSSKHPLSAVRVLAEDARVIAGLIRDRADFGEHSTKAL